MSDVNNQIESRIRTFVAELDRLIRDAAVDAVSNALGGAVPAKRGPGRPAKAAAPRTAPRSVPRAPSKSSHRNVGGVRAPALVAKMIERVRDYVVANPGHGAEKIGPALGASTSQIALPIRKLLASKHITRKGVRRATRYFAGPNATGKLPTPSPAGRPKKK